VTASDLNARYGRTASRRRRNIIGIISLGLFMVVTFTVWAIWSGLFRPTTAVEYVSVGQSRVSSNQLKVTYEISVNTGSPTKCAIQALDQNFGIVGWRIVSIPASSVRSRTFSSIVRTAQPAVSGLIYQCWLS
jgi:hypothetical protein